MFPASSEPDVINYYDWDAQMTVICFRDNRPVGEDGVRCVGRGSWRLYLDATQLCSVRGRHDTDTNTNKRRRLGPLEPLIHLCKRGLTLFLRSQLFIIMLNIINRHVKHKLQAQI